MTDHVKIYGVKPRIQYTADGTLTEYEFPFAIFKTSDIDVYFGDSKKESTSYTVSEARHSDGGTVTFESAPEAGTIITIVRNLSIERTSDFQEGSTLRAKVLNDELDYQIACTQQIAENLNRSMVLPPYATDNDSDLTLPVPSAGKAIVWNSDGTNLENSTVSVNSLESALKGYKEAAESAASTATTKAGIASDKADLATNKAQLASDKADIATAKASEAASTLSAKANKDMDNISTTGKESMIGFCMPDYTAGVSKTIGTSYTAETNGWIFCGRQATSTSTSTPGKLIIDGQEFSFHYFNSSNGTVRSGIFIPVKKGSSYKYENQADHSNEFIFFPCIGG